MSIRPGDWWELSWNPWEGCTPVSEACKNCWALQMLRRFRWQESGDIRFYPSRVPRVRPTRYFVGSLTDVFHEEVPDKDRLRMFKIMGQHPQHIYCLLTKRPELAADFFVDHVFHEFDPLFRDPVFSQIWMGATTENQDRFDERQGFLRNLPSAVRFISAEPLLGPLNLGSATEWLDWVIVGGETGPKAQPMHPDWVWSLRDQCQEAGIPLWFKGWGKYLHSRSYSELNRQKGLYRIWPTQRKGTQEEMIGKNELWNHENLMTGFFRPIGEKTGRLLDGREWSELPEVPHD